MLNYRYQVQISSDVHDLWVAWAAETVFSNLPHWVTLPTPPRALHPFWRRCLKSCERSQACECDHNEKSNHCRSQQTACLYLWKRSESLRKPFNVCSGRTVLQLSFLPFLLLLLHRFRVHPRPCPEPNAAPVRTPCMTSERETNHCKTSGVTFLGVRKRREMVSG